MFELHMVIMPGENVTGLYNHSLCATAETVMTVMTAAPIFR